MYVYAYVYIYREQEERMAKSLAGIHEQQKQLAEILQRERAHEDNIVSKVSMMKIDTSNSTADAALPKWPHPFIGGQDPEEPVIPPATVRRLHANREEFLRSLQEWESILFNKHLNQWAVEDMIAHDIGGAP